MNPCCQGKDIMQNILNAPQLRAAATPDEVVFRTYAGDVTYADYWNRIVSVYAGLKTCCDQAGRVIAVALDDPVELYATIYAIWYLQGVAVPLNPANNARELNAQLEAACPDVLVSDWRETRLSALLGNSRSRPLLVSVPQLSAARNGEAGCVLASQSGEMDAVALVAYTSGTTGEPKGVAHSIRSLSHLVDNTMQLYPRGVDVFSMPCASFGGMQLALLNMACGRPLAVSSETGVADFILRVERFKPKILLSFPRLIQALIELHGEKPSLLDSLEECHSGGEALAAETRSTFYKLKSFPIIHAYGLAECGPICVNRGDDARYAGAAGFAIDGIALRIVALDGSGRESAPDEPGELVVRSKAMAAEYFRRPEMTANAIRDAWLHTGDAAYKDGAGALWLIGRVTDLIVIAGQHMPLSDVEKMLASDHAVKQVAVLVAGHGTAGPKRLAAYISLHDPGRADDLLVDRLRQLVHQAWREEIQLAQVHILAGLPLGPTGKIDRKQLASLERK